MSFDQFIVVYNIVTGVPGTTERIVTQERGVELVLFRISN